MNENVGSIFISISKPTNNKRTVEKLMCDICVASIKLFVDYVSGSFVSIAGHAGFLTSLCRPVGLSVEGVWIRGMRTTVRKEHVIV